MAMERPVVAVGIHGPAEIMRHGETGLLVPPPGEPDALADAIERILAHPSLAAEMGASARKRIVERFDLQHSVDQLDEIMKRFGAEGA
jgi:glycosyltransferase involved in cell wall biosynthesis